MLQVLQNQVLTWKALNLNALNFDLNPTFTIRNTMESLKFTMTFFVDFVGLPNDFNSHTQRIILHSIISIIIQMNKQNHARLFHPLNTETFLLNFYILDLNYNF